MPNVRVSGGVLADAGLRPLGRLQETQSAWFVEVADSWGNSSASRIIVTNRPAATDKLVRRIVRANRRLVDLRHDTFAAVHLSLAPDYRRSWGNLCAMEMSVWSRRSHHPPR